MNVLKTELMIKPKKLPIQSLWAESMVKLQSNRIKLGPKRSSIDGLIRQFNLMFKTLINSIFIPPLKILNKQTRQVCPQKKKQLNVHHNHKKFFLKGIDLFLRVAIRVHRSFLGCINIMSSSMVFFNLNMIYKINGSKITNSNKN